MKRFRDLPARTWFIAAWGLFILSLALPAARIFGEVHWGWKCLKSSEVFLWDVLKMSFREEEELGIDVRYFAMLGVCNLAMVLSAVATPAFPPRFRFFFVSGMVALAATLAVISWFPYDSSRPDVASLPGAWAWAASFVFLTVAFIKAAHSLRGTDGPPL